jgi:hypothetical protein
MKRIGIAPFNKPAQILAEKLKDEKNQSIFFIDSYKYDSLHIFHPKDLHEKDIDQIIIVSPQYYQSIYNVLQEHSIEKNKIFFYDSINNKIYDSKLFYEISLFSKNLLHRLTGIISRHKLKQYQNKHLNQRCFIIGNGPSLQIEDLNRLKDEITFATNKIYLAFDETTWRPTYYFVEDHLVFTQNYQAIEDLHGFEKFFPLISLEWVPKINDSLYYNLIYDFKQNHFGTNPIEGFYWGATVTYTMIQMAIYMGFKEIYLLGVDFSFINAMKNVNHEGTDILFSNGEKNHFHKDYRKAGEQWTEPDFIFQEKSFKSIQEYALTNNISIFNSSRKTQLAVFPLKAFDDVLLPSN